ncbi:putative Kunitz-type serine protease inhibitor [Gastrophryne carolinensis]
MAPRFRVVCLLVFLLPLALASSDLPCDGFELVEGFGMADVETSLPFGVKLLPKAEETEVDEVCWKQCCESKECDMAMTSQGKCYLIRCNVTGFDMCELSALEGARTYRKVNIGAQPQQEDFCLPKNASGFCRASFPRWWYDAETGTCKDFIYGGCPVNLNNHLGEEECMTKCRGVTAKTVDNPPAPQRQVAGRSLPEECSGPSVVGLCRAAFPRWFFNAETETCQKFIFGGCGGSKNNHMSERDCIDKCVAAPAQVQRPNFKEFCAAPPVTGNCRAAFKRFYYDPNTGTCKNFVYGGCNANKNNYMKMEDCVQTCAGRSEDDDHSSDHNVLHRPLTAVILPILLAMLAASLLGIMIVFFVKVAKKNQRESDFRALWNPIDDKECLMNNAYSL